MEDIKIIIEVDGGIVQEVYHNIKGNVFIEILDGDIEDTDPKDLVDIGGDKYYRYNADIGTFDPIIIEDTLKLIK